MSKEIETKVDAALASWGITFTARYIGETVKWEKQKVDHFRVSVGKYETDFYQGLGHRSPQPKPQDGGRPPRRSTLMYEQLERQRKPTPPTAASVLYCLLSDAAAIDQSFDDWAGDFGYDTDSRKALATYEACCDTGRELRRIFTPAQRAELSELLQDY